ncbi:hypothetical protein HCG46_25195 [Labrenzia sp. PO1]|uniref:O-antigen ligase family protein n=1 Tax=Labrenzia sp. PO1 TaxID=2720390 RepID=UPI001445B327|nr:O-antigen ligase family protein [Labrenzia sp. PO1]NKI61594.1 hypothetical protein [Labrenzia sp. PO1]
MTPSAIPISSHSGSPVRSTTSQEIERLLVIAAVFLSPMTYLRTDIVFFTLSDLVASAAFVVMIANRRVPLRPFADMTSFWLFSVLLLCSGLIAGSLLNGDPLTGAVGVIQYVFSFVCIPLLLLGRPARETMFLCKVMAFSLVFVMLHGVLYSVFSPDDARFFSRNGRLTGLIERENGVGLLAGVGIVYVMWLYFISQISGIVFLALVAPVAYGLLLSASNSGFIVAVVGIFGISFFHGSAKHILAFIGIGALALAALFLFGQYFLPEVFQERVYGALTTGDSSEAGTFDGRLLLIQEAIYLIDRSIWLGVGVDQHRLISQYGAPVHNTYLLLFSEGGLVSLLGFVCLLLTLAFVGWRSFSNPDTRWSGVLMFTILLMFAVALNGVTHVYGRFLSVPLLLPAAICLSGYRVRRHQRREHR